MLYAKLTQGKKEVFVGRGFFYKNAQVYDDALLDIKQFHYKLKKARTQVCATKMSLLKRFLEGFDEGLFAVSIFIDATSTTTLKEDKSLFEGYAYISTLNEITATLTLLEKNSLAMFLQNAPALSASTARLYPRAVGLCTHAKPLLLNESSKIFHSAYADILKVYEDGVSVDFVKNNDGTFTLINTPSEDISVDYQNSDTLFSIFTFIAEKMGLNLDTSLAIDTSLNHFFEEQTSMLELLNDLCEYSNHLFFIQKNTLYIVSKKTTQTQDFKDAFSVVRDGLYVKGSDEISQYLIAYETAYEVASFKEVRHEKKMLSKEVLGIGEECMLKAFNDDESTLRQVAEAKKEWAMLQNIQLHLVDVQEVEVGKVMTFDAYYAQGEMLVTGFTYDFENAETVVYGKGKIKEWCKC